MNSLPHSVWIRYDVGWHYVPKAERCLREEFGIAPDPELCSYSIEISDGARELARKYLETVCAKLPPLGRGGQGGSRSNNGSLDSPITRFPVVLIHYEGNTSADHKNIPTPIIARLCHDIIEDGFIPVILDWDYRNALADGVRIHCPDQRAELWHGTGTGDAESLAALTELSTLLIGVDSGPLHVAGATTTPTLGVWTRHHPLHYFSHAANVLHLVPHDHAGLIRGNREAGEAYFAAHYQFQTYRDLEDALRVAVRSRLHDANDPHADNHNSGLVFTRNFWIRTDNGEQDLVVVQDVAEQDSYRIDELPMPRPVVVDVGAHIGCFAKRLHQRNPLARIFAVECCPENITVLQKNVGDFVTVVQAAVTYEPDVALLNAVYANCVTTGGSTLVSRAELERCVVDESRRAADVSPRVRSCELAAPFLTDNEAEPLRVGEYWADFRPMRTVTLEDLMHENGFDFIDILKLDCETSEFSILGKTPSLDRIGVIVGEYHGEDRFHQLVADRFTGWDLRILRDGELGTFWLTNPARTLPTLGRGGQGGALGVPVNPSAIGDERADFAHTSVPTAVGAGNGHASRSGAGSFHYKSIQTRTADGIPMSFAEVLHSLRSAAESDQIHLHGFAASPAIRQACDTFTSEHPEFARKFIENGSGQVLLFERKSSVDPPAGTNSI